ncbi:cucumber peeling cupredoxin-like [Rhododendron vialii]|uniref:cucumber peeling cupredoxin-like n=1 Tax=Rhododendron vialii TaxID=182163 RepID=UPI00265F54EA|nr:cucumber peeling cupredoxin-like [Rhododendron vialii]
MTGRFGVIGCLAVIAAVVMGAAADTYTVGDDLGWTVPPGGPIAYSVWADKETFEVGDTLVFNWTGTHNVARVSTKAEFDNCTANNVIGTIQTASPANFTLDTNVTHYFICTIESHCYLGQKVEITFGNSASPLAAGAFSVVLFALAVSLMSHM